MRLLRPPAPYPPDHPVILGLCPRNMRTWIRSTFFLTCPNYAEAQKELNSLASDWLGEIEEKYEAL